MSARSTLATVASLLAALAGLASLGYGIYALTLRRGVFADIADDASAVSADRASHSDTLNAVLLWVALVLAAIAVLVWLTALILARRGRNAAGWTALGIVLLGAAVAVTGGLIVANVNSVSDAGDGATGYVLVGIGFLVLGLGLLLGAFALRRPPGASTASATAPSGDRAGMIGVYPDPYASSYPPPAPYPEAGPPPPPPGPRE